MEFPLDRLLDGRVDLGRLEAYAEYYGITIVKEQIMGDKISIGGNVTGSAVGSKASLKARDIVTQIQQSGLDQDLKLKFARRPRCWRI